MENQNQNLDQINQEEQNRSQQNQGNRGDEQYNQDQGVVPDDELEGADADTDKTVDVEGRNDDQNEQKEGLEADEDLKESGDE